jgi:NADPH-dependent ferric siderophore reductase
MPASPLRDAMFVSATVSEIEDLTPRMRRVRLQGPRLQALKWTPGQHVRLQVAGLLESALRLHAHDATYHLFAGEETASVAFAAMLRSLPSTAEVHGVIEGATDADHLPLARPLTHVERGDASAANSVVLAAALRALQLPDHPGVAYLAGEARTIQSLRKILVTERGWDRRNIRTKPFWTPGRSGME